MLKKSKLPLLPGYTFEINKVSQEKFHKSQRFVVANETCMLSDIARPRAEGSLLVEEGQVPHTPQNHWLLYDRQVLRFDAYFEDKNRKRKCKIFYYLEDDTIQVVEPKIDNSGCYQGTFIHRHRIPLPIHWRKQHSNATNINTFAAQASGYYSIAHLNVGVSLELYGRQFHLVSCDRFTRLMLQNLGAFVPENEEVFEDQHTENYVPQQSTLVKDIAPCHTQFLKLDRLVLKFTGYWDDRKSSGGQLHHLLVLYYLADDTIEVRFSNGTPLVKRGRLPKSGPIVTLGAPDQPLVLNVLQGKFLMDSSPALGARLPCDWIRDTDLSIGATISVFGRPVTLTNCDSFTQKYYRNKYGIEEFIPIVPPFDEELRDSRNPPSLPLPPYNGFGTFEDSAANCKTIVPVPPKKNFTKFLMKDRHGIKSHILRFSAQLCNMESDVRRFIFSYYLSDDTVSIHEEFLPNSGYAGGKFLERCRLLKPNQDIYKVTLPEFYGPENFYLGAEIHANNFIFRLTGADEYALSYMEQHCNEFPKSSVNLVLNIVREALKYSYKNVISQILEYDSQHLGTISSFQLRDVLADHIGGILTEHEFVTLLRYFATPSEQQLPDSILRSKVHDELRKKLFKDVDLLRVELRNRDPEHTSYISRTDAWAVCRSLPVPISPETLSVIFDRVKTNQSGDINHEDLLYFLDVENQPANYSTQNIVSRRQQIVNVDRIDYTKLIKELRLEEDLVKQTS